MLWDFVAAIALTFAQIADNTGCAIYLQLVEFAYFIGLCAFNRQNTDIDAVAIKYPRIVFGDNRPNAQFI